MLLPFRAACSLAIGAAGCLPEALELPAEDIVSSYCSVLTQQGLNKSYQYVTNGLIHLV